MVWVDQWLDAARRIIESPAGEAARQHRTPSGGLKSISRATLLLTAECEAQAADRATGRHVATSHATLARQMGVTLDTAKYARRILTRLGLESTALTGRHMTRAEREAATAHHGCRQVAYASERFLTLPTRSVRRGFAQIVTASGTIVDPPKSLPKGVSSSFSKRSGHQAQPQAAAPGNSCTNPQTGTKKRAVLPAPSLAAQRLAAELAEAMPVLRSRTALDNPNRRSKRIHLRAIARILDALHLTNPDDQWTGTTLKQAIDHTIRTTGGIYLAGDTQANPLGLLRRQLTHATQHTETPGARRQREAEQHRREQERHEREHTARATRTAPLPSPRASRRLADLAKAGCSQTAKKRDLAILRAVRHQPIINENTPRAVQHR